jgi:hypothetical protein
MDIRTYRWGRIGMEFATANVLEEYVLRRDYDELLRKYNQLLSNNEVNKAVMADLIERK